MKKIVILLTLILTLNGLTHAEQASATSYTDWSEWTESYIAESSERQVEQLQTTEESVTTYRYHNWINENGKTHFCPYTGGSYYGGTWRKNYIDLNYKLEQTGTKIHVTTWCKHYGCDDPASNKLSVYSYNGSAFYYEEVITREGNTKTLYRYRDIIKSSPSPEAHIHVVATGGGYVVTHNGKNDIYHITKATVSEAYCSCGYRMNAGSYSTVELKHKFTDGKCSDCGYEQVNNTPGTYITMKDKVSVYEKPSTKEKLVTRLEKNKQINVISVETNSANNYWGKIADNQYVYMGNLSVNTRPTNVGPRNVVAGSPHYDKGANPYANNWFGQCTWYVWGRVHEVFNGHEMKIGVGPSAWYWVDKVKKYPDLYEVSETPTQYSIAVWIRDDGAYGHVAFVESVKDGVVEISEANYGSSIGYSVKNIEDGKKQLRDNKFFTVEKMKSRNIEKGRKYNLYYIYIK